MRIANVAASSDVVSSTDGRIECVHVPHRGVVHPEAAEASAIRPVTGTALSPVVVLKTEPELLIARHRRGFQTGRLRSRRDWVCHKA